MSNFSRFFPSPPVFEEEDKITEAKLTHVILQVLFGITALTFFTPLFVQESALSLGVLYTVLIASLGMIWGLFMLLHRGYLQLTHWILIGLFWGVITGLIFFTGGVRSQAFFGYFAVVALTGLLLGERPSIGVAGACIATTTFAFYAGENNLFPALNLLPALSTTWFSASAYLIILAVLQNIAARTLRQALHRARTSEAQARQQRDFALQVMNSIRQGLTVTGPQGLEYVNPAFTELVGIPLAQLIGTDPVQVVVPEDRAILGAAHKRRQQGQTDTYEVRFRHTDGSSIQAMVHAVPRWVNNQIVGAIAVITDLTEQRKMEEALTQERDQLQALMDNIPDMIYFKDAASRFTRVNRSQALLLGVADPAQAIGKTDLDYLPSPLRQMVYEEEQRLFRTGEPVVDRLEYHPTREGAPRWISATKVPLRAPNGEIVGLVGISRDVTERELTRQILEKQATELATVIHVSAAISTLLEASELLQTVVDLTQVRFKLYHAHIYLLSDDGQTFRVAAGTGEAGKLLQAQGWQIPLDHPHSIVARVARTREGAWYNHVQSIPYFLPNPLLPETRAELTVPILAADQLLGVFDLQSEQAERFNDQDILIFTALAQQLAVALQNARRYELAQAELAERKRAEAALRETEELFRAAIEAAGAVPYSIRYGADRYTFMGEGIYRLLGLKLEDMTPNVWATLIEETIMLGEGSGLSRLEAMKKAMAGSIKIWQADYRVRLPTGEIRWLSDASVQLTGETGEHTGAIGILQDITERKRVEEALQNLNLDLERRVAARTAELEAANQELEAFSYTISHDLRAPVRAMVGFTAILLEEYAHQIPLAAQNYLQHIRSGAERLGQLVDGLLMFTRLGRQTITRVLLDPTSLVQQAYTALLEMQLGRKVLFTVDPLPPCEADPALLKQLFTHLLENALKYTQAEPEARIHVGYWREEGKDVYFVRDNGIGFDMQYANKLFRVFQQLHIPGEYEGTGIGLALVKRILEKHGGRIWAEAEPSKGATFYFTLAP
ncbi:MAG: hypothetical protein Fur0022_18550 [Anaerolineales bacterium]